MAQFRVFGLHLIDMTIPLRVIPGLFGCVGFFRLDSGIDGWLRLHCRWLEVGGLRDGIREHLLYVHNLLVMDPYHRGKPLRK